MVVVVREATVEDVPVLQEFNIRLARETEDMELDPETLRQGLNAMFADPAKGWYYVAVEEAEVVGCAAITLEFSDWRNGTVWWLQSVYVKESHRKRGVFRLLFDTVMKHVHDDPSVKGLRLLAKKSNFAAHKVYEAMGMSDEHYKTFELMKHVF